MQKGNIFTASIVVVVVVVLVLVLETLCEKRFYGAIVSI